MHANKGNTIGRRTRKERSLEFQAILLANLIRAKRQAGIEADVITECQGNDALAELVAKELG